MQSDGGTRGPAAGRGELAELLEGLKQRSGRSYTALAHRTGLSRSTLHRYCRGVTVPASFGAVERVARVSGAGPAELDRLYRAWFRATSDTENSGAVPVSGMPEGCTAHGPPNAAAAEGTSEPVSPPPADPAEPAPAPKDTAAPAGTGDSPAGSGGQREDGHTGDGRPDGGHGQGDGDPVGRLLPGFSHRLRVAALLLVLVVTSGVCAGSYFGRGDRGGGGDRAGTGGAEAGMGGGPTDDPAAAQLPDGPDWHGIPREYPDGFVGVTLNSDTGDMPGFSTGSVRLWNSYTRWGTIEREPGTYDWRTLDRHVAAARKDDLEVLYTFGGTPDWAAPEGRSSSFRDSSASPPDDLSDWDGFVRKISTRYRGRIDAYELWDLPSHPQSYAGSISTLAELVQRASRIIRRTDPGAEVVCPSFGDLWSGRGRALLRKFARIGGFEYCDAAALKMPPREPDGRPEESIELTETVQKILYEEARTEIRLWNTGPGRDVDLAEPLNARDARNYAVRFYLSSLYGWRLGMRRAFFYSWGSTTLPVVLQPLGGRPTEAGKRVGRLHEWLDGGGITSCGKGRAIGLPEGAYTCWFEKDGKPFAVRWTSWGRAGTELEKGAYRLRHMDGTTERVRAGERLGFGEEPVLIDYRAGSDPVRRAAGG